MLKPTDPTTLGPEEERPVGVLVHQLVEDAKAYARAEADLAKTVAASKGKALALPAALLGVALIVAIAAFGALVLGLFHVLEPAVGPLGAGLITFILFLGIAGALGYAGIVKARNSL